MSTKVFALSQFDREGELLETDTGRNADDDSGAARGACRIRKGNRSSCFSDKSEKWCDQEAERRGALEHSWTPGGSCV